MAAPSLVDADDRRLLGTALGLSGRVAVVTGATSGIGEALALGLARLGMKVMGVGRRRPELDRVAELAASEGLAFATSAADVTDEVQIDGAMQAAVDTYGSLDGVVANAGIAVVQPAIDVSAASFRSVIDTNLTGAFLTARAAARRMPAEGSVVFTSSSFARRGFNDWSSYNASKAGVSMLTETLASEWISRGIRVNAIAPTATLTPVNAALFEDEAFTAAVVAGIPARRILQAAELVLPVAFLLSPRNQMLIGQTLFVDGGQAL